MDAGNEYGFLQLQGEVVAPFEHPETLEAFQRYMADRSRDTARFFMDTPVVELLAGFYTNYLRRYPSVWKKNGSTIVVLRAERNAEWEEGAGDGVPEWGFHLQEMKRNDFVLALQRHWLPVLHQVARRLLADNFPFQQLGDADADAVVELNTRGHRAVDDFVKEMERRLTPRKSQAYKTYTKLEIYTRTEDGTEMPEEVWSKLRSLKDDDFQAVVQRATSIKKEVMETISDAADDEENEWNHFIGPNVP